MLQTAHWEKLADMRGKDEPMQGHGHGRGTGTGTTLNNYMAVDWLGWTLRLTSLTQINAGQS